MYATCLFCHHALGSNESIEPFPVGKRLAFDADRGRLWVICRHCRQWNLSPLDERWEAIEECERRFRGTHLRVSTDQVGLAKLPDGLELVRIGRPQRPEFAAWRYGEQLGRRRRTAYLQVGIGLGVLGAVVVGGAVAGVGFGGLAQGIAHLAGRIVKGSPNKIVARLPNPGWIEPVIVRRKDLPRVQLIAEGSNGWSLGVPHGEVIRPYTGETALQAMGPMLAQINRFGGTREDVSRAVHLLEGSTDPLHFIHRAADRRHVISLDAADERHDHRAHIAKLPEPTRLAIEMAAHEESERRALEGELARLEAAWREAEEIARISDDMFVPAWITERIARWRG